MRAAQPDPINSNRSAGSQRWATSGLAAGPEVSSRFVIVRDPTSSAGFVALTQIYVCSAKSPGKPGLFVRPANASLTSPCPHRLKNGVTPAVALFEKQVFLEREWMDKGAAGCQVQSQASVSYGVSCEERVYVSAARECGSYYSTGPAAALAAHAIKGAPPPQDMPLPFPSQRLQQGKCPFRSASPAGSRPRTQ